MSHTPDPKTIARQIDTTSFDEWYRTRTFTRNIQNRTPHYNDPTPVQAATTYTPHNLLQCHRKVTYRQTNAPAERRSPDGLFWTSRKIETDLVLPFLRDIVTDDQVYVTDSLYVDSTIDSPHGPLELRGKTDPVIIDRTVTPLLVTEVKTTGSVAQLDQPHPHHRAQAHAYMYGLSTDGDTSPPDAIILYVDRSTLELESFYEPFDSSVWGHIREWVLDHTRYRDDESLPPGTPEYPWECATCPFEHRCGKSDKPFLDIGPTGLLPGYTEYPRRYLIDYLDTYAASGAKLTPSLAHVHPDLAAKYGAYNWLCATCSETFQWDEVNPEPTDENPPVCPRCADDGVLSTLCGPLPGTQCEP